MIFKVYFELLPKLSDFVNSDDSIGKITSKFIGRCPVCIEKRFEDNKKKLFLVKKS